MEFGVMVYEATKAWPKAEVFGLTGQVRRASVSVAANIAEAYGRASGRDFANFPSVARGSLLEAETLVELARRVGYLDGETALQLQSHVDEI